MDCLFCMTGRASRGTCPRGDHNQVPSVEESASLTNVVYGYGRAARQATNVLKSISVLTSAWGLGWSPKARRALRSVCAVASSASARRPAIGSQPNHVLHEGRLGGDACRGWSATGHAADDPQLTSRAAPRPPSSTSFDGVNDSDEHAAELPVSRGIPAVSTSSPSTKS